MFYVFRAADETTCECPEQDTERTSEDSNRHPDERTFRRFIDRCELRRILERERPVLFTLDDDQLFKTDEPIRMVLFQLTERLIRDRFLWERERDDVIRLFFLFSYEKFLLLGRKHDAHLSYSFSLLFRKKT